MADNKVVLVDVVRTAWGKPGGSMEKLMSSDLAAAALQKLLDCTHVAADTVDQVVFGQAHPSTMPNNIGHYAWLKARLPESVPGYTVQSNTASALQAVRCAYYLIASGNEQIVVAGGADSYSAAPFVMRNVRNHFYPADRMVIDSLDEAERDTQPVPMSRLEQYQKTHLAPQSERARLFAAQSRENAKQAVGLYKDRIASVSYVDRKKGETIVSDDEWIAKGVDPDAVLSPYADGVAVAMLMSEDKAKEAGVKPAGEILGLAVAGGDVINRQSTGAQAAQKLLARKGLTMADVDVVEVLENSAEDALAVVDALGKSPRVNPLGGALSYGLNDGAEGIAMLQRLMFSLRSGQIGLACIYSAGGQGMAALIKKW